MVRSATLGRLPITAAGAWLRAARMALLVLPVLAAGCGQGESSPPAAPSREAAPAPGAAPGSASPSARKPRDAASGERVDRPSPSTETDTSTLFPYVIPEAYPAADASGPPGFERQLGHGLRLVVVRWDGLVVEFLRPADLAQLGITPDVGIARAIKNLKTYLSSDRMSVDAYPGPGGVKFMVFEGHLASSAMALDDLYAFCSKSLGAERMVVSVPHRDVLVVFPECTADEERALMEIIWEKESNAPKPLTFDLFELDAAGLRPRS